MPNVRPQSDFQLKKYEGLPKAEPGSKIWDPWFQIVKNTSYYSFGQAFFVNICVFCITVGFSCVYLVTFTCVGMCAGIVVPVTNFW